MFAGCTLAIGGCAATLSVPSARVDNVPFHAQTQLQCGPAALASLLDTVGRSQSVPALTQWLFTPGLSGALQQDVLAAARRAGALPIRIAPQLHALQTQLAQGRPVLVLENLALPRWPHWRYAAVTAIDAQAGTITVGGPSGDAQRIAARKFMRAWQ